MPINILYETNNKYILWWAAIYKMIESIMAIGAILLSHWKKRRIFERLYSFKSNIILIP